MRWIANLTPWVLLWAIAVATTAPAPAADQTNSTFFCGPPADWVKPQFFDGQSLTDRVEAGSSEHRLLSEQQVNAQDNEIFYHSIRQILNVSAVDDASKLAIDFNPEYQTLTLHWARIWRGAEHLERLNTNAVRIIRREDELNDDILNGEESALLVMDDVRVGDIIDYAYSVKGANPVMGGHFFCAVPAQSDHPVERFYTRVLWPVQRQLYAKPHAATIEPAVVRGKEMIEYIWDARQVRAVQLQDSLPSWFEPEPWVQLSDFKTWAQVNQWALPLFANTAPLSPAVTEKIDEWKRLPSREDQVLAALRFVQDDVRYFGVEIGINGEKPCDPSTVFTRRYGDCKDKSLLFVTVLRALGIEAYPVLVNSDLHHSIENWQPTGYAFDHCIAVVYLNGKTYWLDPTIQFQRGPLDAHYLPNYECGLVISPRTTGLTVIPQTAGMPETTTTEYLRLGRKNEPANLKVVTVARGRDADRLRETFATTRRSDIERTYTHYYADRYPDTKMAAPVVFQDNQAEDQVETIEQYTIDDAWAKPDKGGKYSFEFYPAAIEPLLRTPVDMQRAMPIAVPYPEHQIVRTEITLPAEWAPDAVNKTVADPAFYYQKILRCSGNRLVMKTEYQSRADFVAPADAPTYLQHLKQASQSLGYALSW